MGNKRKLEIDGLRVAVVTPGSRPALEWNCSEVFSLRCHWERKRAQRIAAMIRFKAAAGVRRGRALSASFRAVLVNVTSNEEVSARTFSVRLERDEEQTEQRVDVVAREDMLHERYEYELQIRCYDTNEVVAAHRIKFYEMPDCKVYNLRIRDAENGDAELMAVDTNCHSTLTLEYTLHGEGFVSSLAPEMVLTVTDSSEARREMFGELDLSGCVRYAVGVDTVARGDVYFELSCLGRRLAGCVVPFAFSDRYGDYSHAMLRPEYERELKPAEVVEIEDFDALLDAFIKENTVYDEDEPETEDDPEPAEEVPAESSAMDELDAMVGLEGVKSKVRSHFAMAQFFNMRRNAQLPVRRPPLHAMFLGAPGTGKTTVARIMGRLMKEAGMLSSGHVVVTERSKLVGKYYGDEEKATREALEQAQGGILFIDEAYQLYRREDPKDPGRMVLETMMTALADTQNRDWQLVLAGYTEPMLKMLECNPGLASRVPVQNHYMFEDYTAEQLELIADKYLGDNQYAICDDARELLRRLLRHDCDHRDENFGNARHVLNLLETGVLPAMAERVVALKRPSVSDLTTICAADIPAPVQRSVPARRSVGFAV